MPTQTRSPRLILASASPRRAELLRQIGVDFRPYPVDLDETPLPGESPENHVLRLARSKAEAAWQRLGQPADCLVLGSDTTVSLDGEILGKPADEAECLAMLSRLSGRTHEVLTGVALLSPGEGVAVECVTSRVSFRAIEPAEMKAYWRSGEPRDKAGAYAIQGRGAVFVRHIEGSYSAVVGLPLYEVAQMLGRAGFDFWQPS